ATLRPYPWRSGAAVRLVAGGAVALRKSAGLWPRAGELRRCRFRRPRLQHHAVPPRRPAGNRAGDFGWWPGFVDVVAALARRADLRKTIAFEAIEGHVTFPHIDGEIRDGRHHMQVRVYYEDTDFSGIVYHANYLRFMERGRTNHLRLLGAEQHVLFAEAQAETPGFAFVVRSMQIDFLKPARMDDILDVVTWPVAVKGASIMLAQEVRKAEEVLVKAEVRVAFISEGRAQPIPKTLRGLLRADVT